MLRDFSEASKRQLLYLVSQVEDEQYSNFTDWVGDRWFEFEEWIGSLNIRNYINNVNDYHKKVIDKNNSTKKAIEKIFAEVKNVDDTYALTYSNINDLLEQWQNYINEMNNIVTPSTKGFNVSNIDISLGAHYSRIQDAEVEVARSKMQQVVGGVITYNLGVISECLSKDAETLSVAEKIAVISTINDLAEKDAHHATILSWGDEKAAAYIGYLSNYVDEEKAYFDFITTGAYYNNSYIKILSAMGEAGDNKASLAAQLLSVGNEGFNMNILGIETSGEVKKFLELIPVGVSGALTGYISKIETEHTKLYAGKVSLEGGVESSANVKIKEVYESKLKQDKTESSVIYDPKTGEFRECGKDEYKTLKEEAKLLDFFEASVGAEASLLEGTLEGESKYANGSVTAKIGNAKAEASIGAGLYVYDDSGNKLIAPTVKAEVGASVSALNVSADGRLGTENIGAYGNAEADILEAEAEASAKFTVFDNSGNLDLQAGVKAGAEANIVEVSGSAGATVLGADVGVSGSLKVGIGAEAEVGYVDGHFKMNLGVSVGVGASVGVDIDVGGLIDGVATKASDTWSDVCEMASDAGDWLGGLFD